jgi:enamine deaminase RidA (YjgF/YER057c/UK114 family)
MEKTAAVTTVYERLKALQITLPELPPPVIDGYVPLFVPFVRTGNLIYVSGRLAKQDGKPYAGKLGRQITTAEGRQAARDVAIEVVATLQTALGDLNKVKRIAVSLFEHLHRRDARGASRGKEAGGHRDDPQQHRHNRERRRVARRHTEEEARHQPRHDDRCTQPNNGSCGGENEAGAECEAEDIQRLRTQGQPNAELLRALPDDERHHTINPQRSEQERRHCKDRH